MVLGSHLTSLFEKKCMLRKFLRNCISHFKSLIRGFLCCPVEAWPVRGWRFHWWRSFVSTPKLRVTSRIDSESLGKIIMISSWYHHDIISIISCSSVKSLKNLLRYREVVNDIDAWEPKVQSSAWAWQWPSFLMTHHITYHISFFNSCNISYIICIYHIHIWQSYDKHTYMTDIWHYDWIYEPCLLPARWSREVSWVVTTLGTIQMWCDTDGERESTLFPTDHRRTPRGLLQVSFKSPSTWI